MSRINNFTVSKLSNGWLVSGNLGSSAGFYIESLEGLSHAMTALEAEVEEMQKRWDAEKQMQYQASHGPVAARWGI